MENVMEVKKSLLSSSKQTTFCKQVYLKRR